MRRLLLLLLWLLPVPAMAQSLIADVSSHIINVRTDFTGAELVLFGALEAPLGAGDDLLISITSPEADLRVREKTQMGLFWLNGKPVDIRGIPRFYHLLWARGEEARAAIQADRETLRLSWQEQRYTTSSELPLPEQQRLLKAFMDTQVRRGAYAEKAGAISFLGDRLFRASIAFSPLDPVGTYQVRVYLIRGGVISAAQSSNLLISKAGIGADLAWSARRYPLLYGLTAVLMALASGWLGYRVFRRMT